MVIVYIVAAYLLGSIPVGLVLARLKGQDPRKVGSGNIGATNVMRAAGKTLGIITLLGDILKGFIPTGLAILYGLSPVFVVSIGLAAFLGHLFPVWLRFKGGKGVATAAGVLFALDWRVGIAVLLVWITVVMVSRYSSLGALTASLFAPVAVYFLLGAGPLLPATCVMCAMLIWRHEGNIRKLLHGTESRIGEKKAVT